jgi:hypothetical protein
VFREAPGPDGQGLVILLLSTRHFPPFHILANARKNREYPSHLGVAEPPIDTMRMKIDK